MALTDIVVNIIPKISQRNVNQTTKQFEDAFSRSALKISNTMKATLGGVFAALGGLSIAGVVNASRESADLLRFAETMGVAADEAVALSAVTETVGISLDKLADISKDVSDRLGDYVTAQSGPFQDVVDVLGISQEAGSALAAQLGELSAPAALAEIVTLMEQAGASADQFTFVLESIANDASYLMPLLRNGGAEFARMTAEAEKAIAGVAPSDDQLGRLAKLSFSFSLFGKVLSSSFKKLSASVTTFMTEGISLLIAMMPGLVRLFSGTFSFIADILTSFVRVFRYVFVENTTAGIITIIGVMAVFRAAIISTAVALATLAFNPFVLAVAGIVALVLAIEDLIQWINGGQSALGSWLGSFDDFKEKVIGVFNQAKAAVKGFFDFIGGYIQKAVTGYSNYIFGVFDMVREKINSAIALLKSVPGLSSLFGSEEQIIPVMGSVPAMASGFGGNPTSYSTSNNSNVSNTFNITGVSNPESAARLVRDQQAFLQTPLVTK